MTIYAIRFVNNWFLTTKNITRKKIIFTASSENTTITTCGVFLVTFQILCFVMIHWIEWIEWKSFRKSSIHWSTKDCSHGAIVIVTLFITTDSLLGIQSTITLRLSFQSESSVSRTELRDHLKIHYKYALAKWIRTTRSVNTYYAVSTSFSAYS